MINIGAVGRSIVTAQIDKTQQQVSAMQVSIQERDGKIEKALTSPAATDGVAASALGGRGLKVDVVV